AASTQPLDLQPRRDRHTVHRHQAAGPGLPQPARRMSNTDTLSPTPFAIMGARPLRTRMVWLLARLRALWLDRQLAAGVVPWHSKVHAARSLQLTSDRSRRALARSLEHLVEQADGPPVHWRSAAVPPCRPQVSEARPVILA